MNYIKNLILSVMAIAALSLSTAAKLPNVNYAGMVFQKLSTPPSVRKVTSLPATCTAVGAASSSDAVLYQGRVYICTATDTWTAILTTSTGANAALSNLASVSINASLVPQTTLNLGAQATPWKELWFYGNGTFGSHSYKITGTPTAHRVLTFLDATQTLAGSATALTSGRLPYVTTGGLLADSANATLDSSGNGVFNSLNIVTGQSYKINSVSMLKASTTLNNFFVGPSGNLTASGTDNSGVGVDALIILSSGIGNVANGYRAAYLNTTGSYNIALGYQAGQSNQTGSYNVNLGYQAGYSSTGVGGNVNLGKTTGFDVTSGVENTFIGNNTGRGITTGSYNTVIGAAVTGLSSSLAQNIILADGLGNVRLQFSSTGLGLFKSSYGLASMAYSITAPTITSAGTSPSIVASNGTAAFVVNVGTGGTATAIVLGMPTAAAGWICHATNITATAANRADQAVRLTASTTTSVTLQNQTVSTGAALAFTASDVVRCQCTAY